MTKFLFALLAVLIGGPAFAADNAIVLTPGVGVTERSIDVGSGVQAPGVVPVGVNGTSAWGTAGTANANVVTVQGIAAGTPLIIEGGAATGAAKAGNPVRIGLSDGTNAQDWLTALILGDGVNGNNTAAVAPWVWNGTTWDRMPGTTAGVKITVANGADVTLGAVADAAYAGSGSASVIAALKGIYNGVTGAIPAGAATIGNVGGTVTPAGATPITATATGTTGATTATLAGTTGKTTYMCWMSIRANATAAATGNATVTGTVTATLNFTQWTAPLATGLGVTEMIFNPCVPASTTDTAIAVISAAPGVGGVVSVSAGGFQL